MVPRNFLLGRRATQPVTDFQVCDEASRHGQCRTYNTAHHQCRNHPFGTFQPYGYHDYGCQD